MTGIKIDITGKTCTLGRRAVIIQADITNLESVMLSGSVSILRDAKRFANERVYRVLAKEIGAHRIIRIWRALLQEHLPCLRREYYADCLRSNKGADEYCIRAPFLVIFC